MSEEQEKYSETPKWVIKSLDDLYDAVPLVANLGPKGETGRLTKAALPAILEYLDDFCPFMGYELWGMVGSMFAFKKIGTSDEREQ